MTIKNTWDGCAWVLALVLYPLTMIGWWLRNSGGSIRLQPTHPRGGLVQIMKEAG